MPTCLTMGQLGLRCRSTQPTSLVGSGCVLVRPGPSPPAVELAALADLGGHAVHLAQGRLEGVADGKTQLLVGAAAGALVADHDRVLARHGDLDLDPVDLGLLRVALSGLDADAAARHAIEMLGQLGDLLAHALFDGVALLEPVEMNLDWRGHEIAPFKPGTYLSTWDRP